MIGSVMTAHDQSTGGRVSRAGGGPFWRGGPLPSTTPLTTHPSPAAAPDPQLVPAILAAWLSVFRPCFTVPVWNRILVLVAGAVLAPGKRTVTQVLRVMGLADEPSFRRYHEVLSRAR